MNKTLFALLSVFSLLLVSTGCTRASQDDVSSEIKVHMPSRGQFEKSLQSTPFPADKKICFGVNVSAPDIPATAANSCAPALGVAAGFVGAGETLSLSVTKGTNRKFELFAFLVEPTEACPSLNAAMLAEPANLSKAYVVGVTAGVELSKAEEEVRIAVAYPGPLGSLSSTAAAVCQSVPTLKASLLSNGDVINSDFSLNATLSSPILTGLYMTGLSDARGVGRISSSGVLNPGSSSAVQLPPWLTSLTRKPDTGEYFALDHGGQLYKLTLGSDAPVALSATNCPFAVSACKVPAWMQSISAGMGTQLYGLDHGGQVYALGPTEPSALSFAVEPNVVQISFY